MAEFKITGRLSVDGLRNQFKKTYGLTLRVYKGSKFADGKATLASLSDKKVEDFECSGNLMVGNFEKRFENATGLKVQVATGDDKSLVKDDLTLSKAQSMFSEK